MPTFPLRHAKYPNFNTGRRTRHVVAAAFQDQLLVTARAFEILSVVAGVQLARVQRQALWPTLHELLTDPSLATIGAGPQSQADVLGACLGLATFAVSLAPGAWSFVHIPTSRTRSPDIYALEDGGASWFIELKAVAPSDSEVDLNGPLDTCKRVSNQRRVAIQQLRNPAVPVGPAPAIRVVGARGRAAIATNAVAFIVSVVSRAGLSSRADVGAPGKPGCPRSRGVALRCADQCLDGRYQRLFITCPVVVWGEQARPPLPAGNPGPRLLGSIRMVNGGLWSGSAALVDAAMQDMSHTLARTDQGLRSKLASMMRDLLRATRLHSTKHTRAALVEALGQVGEAPEKTLITLHSEGSRGIEQLPLEREVRPAQLAQSAPVEGVEHIVCQLRESTARGTRTKFGIRLAPHAKAAQPVARAELSPERYLRGVLPGEPVFLAETLRLIERLVEDAEATPHPNPLRAKPGFVLGHSWTDAGGTAGWVSTDGLLELRYG